MSSPATPATIPATPAAFRKFRREIAGMHWHQLLDVWFAYADAYALVVIAEMGGDRAQAVVTGDATANFDSDLCRRQIDLVVKYHDAGRLEFVEIGGLRHRSSGFVHVSAIALTD